MKKFICAITVIVLSLDIAFAQFGAFPESYKIAPDDVKKYHELIPTFTNKKVSVPNTHPDAQWFPDASLGLFMHWGIHSVVGAQPSWDMIAHYKYGGKFSPPDKYYALAPKFNPKNYDPDKWLKAAKDAGFNYAVLTTKHHDGYALWPSKYGIGTKQFMEGRDLLKPYVEACRKNGLKVGFYFSPRDWHYPGYMHPNEFDANTMRNVPPVTDTIANQRSFDEFFAFTLRQIEELLTRYGKIDILWFDGMGFRGISNMYTKEVYAWIRSLQPGIVINDRWAGVVNPDTEEGNGFYFGDFATMFEGGIPDFIPDYWWEHCGIWTQGDGGWGYEKDGTFLPYSWFFEHLVASRSMGGNFLPNVGPSGDGEMHPNYYKNIEAVAQWMKHSKESVIGNGPTPGAERSNVMITTRDKTWYLHLLPGFKSQVSVKTDKKPKSVVLLRNGNPLQYSFRNGFVRISVPAEYRTEMDDVVKVEL